MTIHDSSRRDFLKSTAAGALTPYFLTGAKPEAHAFAAKSDRHTIGCIGLGFRWKQIVGPTRAFGDVAAVCDVDSQRAEAGKKIVGEKASVYGDYRRILDRKDIDVVTIVTPDHWHTKMAIEAMQAGKDVYCEKPLTLTIDEGKQIIKVLKETGRVFQVGTQQRSEMGLNFLTAVAMVKEGRLGKIKKVQCATGGSKPSGPLKKVEKPDHLDWKMWQGQAPLADYHPRRLHYEFRYWFEYSGGNMTDWGVHHVDIAQWALGMDHSGPLSVEAQSVTLPVPLVHGMPTRGNAYNTATEFSVKAMFPGGVKMIIRHDTDNGILFEGDKGRIFVGRGRLSGKPVEQLKENPLPADVITKLYKGKKPGNHLGNFFECIKTRKQPISDVYTHHRSITTCHLANIAIRLGRKVRWDAKAQQIIGDKEANAWLRREQRKGYEINVNI